MGQRVQLLKQEFNERAQAAGLETVTAQAAALGVNPSIHSRVLTGRRKPNAVYVLRILKLFPDASPDALFEVVDANGKTTS